MKLIWEKEDFHVHLSDAEFDIIYPDCRRAEGFKTLPPNSVWDIQIPLNEHGECFLHIRTDNKSVEYWLWNDREGEVQDFLAGILLDIMSLRNSRWWLKNWCRR